MSPLVEVGFALVELGSDIAAGRLTDALAVVRRLEALIVDKLIPVTTLKPYLTERDRIWADLAVDIAETAKVDAAADAAEKAKLDP